jgi:hypothetical protein
LDEEKNKGLNARYTSLLNEHLFHDAVQCAKKIFGYEENDAFIDLKEGSSQISSEEENYMYLRYTPEKADQLHTFSIQASSSFEVAYDYLNCEGRAKITKKPNKDDGYCQFISSTFKFDFEDFESNGSVYIGIKLAGTATVKVTTKEIINLGGGTGAKKSQYTDYYQSYKYQADDIGYVVIKTTTKITGNSIQLYHNTEDCKRDKTIYPRPSHFCMKSAGNGNTSLIIPSTQGNEQLHYFGVLIGALDRVNLTMTLFLLLKLQ